MVLLGPSECRVGGLAPYPSQTMGMLRDAASCRRSNRSRRPDDSEGNVLLPTEHFVLHETEVVRARHRSRYDRGPQPPWTAFVRIAPPYYNDTFDLPLKVSFNFL